ncbi:acid-sensing ion channel 5 [Nephila pilipes]|nr:acid-sensing ion channel 5 [Nephila pilipes]
MTSEFVSNSSIYIVSQISRSLFLFGKIAWGLMLVTSFIICVLKIQNFWFLYQQYPIVINLHVEHKQSLEFPAVSVCNLNRMKQEKGNCPGRYTFQRDGSIATPYVLSERKNIITRKINQNVPAIERKNSDLEFLMEYYGMEEEERFQLGHKPSDFLGECSFQGRQCAASNLSFFTSFRYGNCITFNKKSEKKEPLRISDTGIGTGLILTLDIEYCHYSPRTHARGARVVVHSPEENPNPEEDGFTLGPGFETTISLKQIVFRRLTNPYKDHCMDYKSQPEMFMSNRFDCIRNCMQDYNYVKCGCTDPTLTVMKNLKPCRFTNKTHMDCLDEALSNITQYGSMCKCPLPCTSIYYNEKLSKAVFPSIGFFLKKRIFQDGFTESRERYLQLNIFYSSLDRHVYQQLPKWQATELLSYLGNQLGLWLGLSLVAVFEFLEKLILFINYLVFGKYN